MIEPEPINVTQEMTEFTRRMQEKCYKLTPQRLKLAKWIFQVHDHFSIKDLVFSFRRNGENISVATAYRVVQMMLELQLLQENDFGMGEKLYEHTQGHKHHDHLICNDCKQIFEFNSNSLEKLKAQIARDHGFEMTFHSLNIHGDCQRKNCQNLSNNSD